MSATSIYHDAINKSRIYSEDRQTDESLPNVSAQVKFTWLQHPSTQDFFVEQHNEIVRLENQARELACAYHKTGNYRSIIDLLIRAEELRKLIRKYGNPQNTRPN